MSLRPKPIQNSETTANAYIDRGGSIAMQEAVADDDESVFPLRLRRSMNERIAAALKKRPARTSKNSWIVEKLAQALDAEEQSV